tara:strand:+ start:462 stop:698 length:237 start_codon:yes stop_codon:yes gene_type:complete
MEEYVNILAQPPMVEIDPPPEITREFSDEFKKARKKFGQLAEKKINAAMGAERGMGGDKEMVEAARLMVQMKELEFIQ